MPSRPDLLTQGQTTDAADPSRPLCGVRVLENVRGPMGALARMLSELGADVVKLEPDGGSPDRREGRMAGDVSLEFIGANLGKRSTNAGRLQSMVVAAHILIDDSGTLNLPALRSLSPALLTVAVSPFGADNDFTDWRGSEAVYHALSAQLSRSGLPGSPPLIPPGNLASECAVTQAFYAVMGALSRCIDTGEPDHLDFAILDGTGQVLDPGFGISGSAAAGTPASAMPRGRPDVAYRYPVIRCADGYVRLCVVAPKQWQGIFEWMGRPEQFSDPKFANLIHRFKSPELLPFYQHYISDKTRAEVEAGGREHGFPCAAVFSLAEGIRSEQMAARGAICDVELPDGGTAPFPNGGVQIDGVRMGPRGGAPQIDPALEWHDAPPPSGFATHGDRPLSGLKVIDLGIIVVGAEAGRLLGDLGADVIKVESRTGMDGMRQHGTKFAISPTFVPGHRNKRSVGLNLRDAGGKALLIDLLRDADVLLTNFKGGTLERLGLDYATLKQINPRLVMTDSSAFGDSGPWSKRMGYGPLVRAWAGLSLQWRYPDDPMSFSDALTVYPDHTVGRVVAGMVIAMLMRRARTGEGGLIVVSQAEVMLTQFAADIAATARDDWAKGGVEPTSVVVPCKGDDEWCAVTLAGDEDDQRLAQVTGGLELGQWLATQEPISAMNTLQAAGIAAGAMLRVIEMPDWDYFQQRGYFRRERHTLLPYEFWVENAASPAEKLPEPPLRQAPQMCEHTREVLTERLGLDAVKIDALEASGAIEIASSESTTPYTKTPAA